MALAAMGTCAYIPHAESGEIKKPTISEPEAKKGLSSLLSGVYQDAKKYNLSFKEEDVEAISKQIWPDVRYIIERRYVITDK